MIMTVSGQRLDRIMPAFELSEPIRGRLHDCARAMYPFHQWFAPSAALDCAWQQARADAEGVSESNRREARACS